MDKNVNIPTVSVVVPFYNAAPYIPGCIRGLVEQTYPAGNYEIIMVDNNSTDGSAEVVRRSPRIRLLSETRQGSYAARNKGVRNAKGDIIAFIDPDCVPFDDWLCRIVEAFSESCVGIVIGRLLFPQRSFSLRFLEAYENEKSKYVFNSDKRDVYFGHTNNMAVRRTIFSDVGPFIERPRGSDTIFVRQCIAKYSSSIVRYCPEVRVRHMEIKNVSNYLRKVFIYGNSRRSYRHICDTKPLSSRERLKVFRATIRKQGLSGLQLGFVFVLLMVGLLCWSLGSAKASWCAKQETRRMTSQTHPSPQRMP